MVGLTTTPPPPTHLLLDGRDDSRVVDDLDLSECHQLAGEVAPQGNDAPFFPLLDTLGDSHAIDRQRDKARLQQGVWLHLERDREGGVTQSSHPILSKRDDSSPVS